MKINRIGYLFKEGLRGVFSHGFRSFASVTVIAACLIIMGSFALVAVNVDNLIDEMEKESQILAFVDDSLSDDDALLLEGAIRSISNVREVRFIDREEAFENYKASYDDSTIFEDLDASVLRNRYVVYLSDITLMKQTDQALRAVPGIADVNSQISIANGFITLRNVVSVVTAILIVILLVVSVFMMSNTIKLATFTRREEIAIMRMVGANNGFIRFPFVVEGLILGLLGAGIGFVLEWGVYNFITNRIMNSIAANLFRVMPFSSIMTPMLIVYLAVGVLVGAFGGAIAIRNYLKV
ncbi:MAG: permease-like cell division protein FtsX [Oscillospiraceae bacterium]|nr:permease-like cell division protein FtsX [Oscillospiraceae bacterium]